jgi:uncharacterized protein with von Willebrand factor type A (vWA) domain
MNREELLRLLDLGGKDAATTPGAEVLAIRSVPAEEEKVASPTVLEIDAWGLRRGRELLDESERLKKLNLGEHAVADFHAAAFDPDPRVLPACTDRRRHAFLIQLLETPEFQSLHTATRLDATASEIAAVAFAEQFATLPRKEGQEDSEDADGGTGRDGLDGEMETLRAVGRAVVRATEEVQECHEAAASLGMGPGLPGSNDPQGIAELFRRVRGNPVLRRICDLAGRYRRLAQSRQRRKVSHGLDDLVGVEPDGDLGRLLPSELAKLALPEFELDALRRVVERQALCRAYQASEPVARGPILVSLDESGSMQGSKIETGKALALALAWIARQQGRWVGLLAYSGDSGERLLPLAPGRWDEAGLMDWLCAVIGRGSNLDVPVREMPRVYQQLKAPPGDTDVIFITDCLCRIPEPIRESFLHWKQTVKARLITLVIGSTPGDLARISDEVHLVPSLAASEPAVERVLSI